MGCSPAFKAGPLSPGPASSVKISSDPSQCPSCSSALPGGTFHCLAWVKWAAMGYSEGYQCSDHSSGAQGEPAEW